MGSWATPEILSSQPQLPLKQNPGDGLSALPDLNKSSRTPDCSLRLPGNPLSRPPARDVRHHIPILTAPLKSLQELGPMRFQPRTAERKDPRQWLGCSPAWPASVLRRHLFAGAGEASLSMSSCSSRPRSSISRAGCSSLCYERPLFHHTETSAPPAFSTRLLSAAGSFAPTSAPTSRAVTGQARPCGWAFEAPFRLRREEPDSKRR